MTNQLTTEQKSIEIGGKAQTIQILRKGRMSRAAFEFAGKTYTLRFSEYGNFSIDLNGDGKTLHGIGMFYHENKQFAENQDFRAAVKVIGFEMADEAQRRTMHYESQAAAIGKLWVEAKQREQMRDEY